MIHRDIKPGNLLLDKDGKLFVTDFGLARIETDPRITMSGDVLGTLRYMSPEQILSNRVVIDHRTDVYSLGATLYELLTLQPMIPAIERPDIIKQISLEEPSTPRKLNSDIPTDLETIVLKATRKNPDERYESSSAFAADLQSFLDDKPITAKRPTSIERVSKWTRRNPTIVASVLVILLLSTIGMAIGNVLILKQKDIADQNFAETLKQKEIAVQKTADALKQKQIADSKTAEALKLKDIADEKTAEAQTQRDYARAIADFVNDDFLALTSVSGQIQFDEWGSYKLTKDTTLRQLLDRAAEKLDSRSGLDPAIEAELRGMIGSNYHGLGEYERAINYLKKSFELYAVANGDNDEATLDAKSSLAIAYFESGDLETSQPMFEQIWDTTRTIYSDEHPNTLTQANNIGRIYLFNGRYDEAIKHFDKALQTSKAELGEDDQVTLLLMDGLALSYLKSGQIQKSLPLFEKVRQLTESTLPIDHPDTLTSMKHLAMGYAKAGQLDRAIPLFETTLKMRQEILGEDDPAALRSMTELAHAYLDAGSLDKASLLSEKTLKMAREKLGEESPEALVIMSDVARAYLTKGQFENAIKIQRTVLEIETAKYGEDHNEPLISMNNLAFALLKSGQNDEAVSLLEKLLVIRRTKNGEIHADTMQCVSLLAQAYRKAGKSEKALLLLKRTLNVTKNQLGKNHPAVLRCLHDLAVALVKNGQHQKAVPLLVDTLQRAKELFGNDHPNTINCLRSLGGAYYSLDDLDNSIPIFEEAVQLSEDRVGRDHIDSLGIIATLGVNYFAAGRFDEAILHLQEAADGCEKHPELAWVYGELSRIYGETGDAKPLLEIERTLTLLKTQIGNDHPGILKSLENLAEAYGDLQDLEEKCRLQELVLSQRLETFGETQLDTIDAMNALANTYWRQDKLDDSIPLFERALKLKEAQLPRTHYSTRLSVANLGINYLAADRLDEAVILLEEIAEASKTDSRLAFANRPLCTCYAKAGEKEKFRVFAEKLIANERQKHPEGSPKLAGMIEKMGRNFQEIHDFERAELLLRESWALRKKGADPQPRIFNSQSLLGSVLVDQRRFDEAEPMLLESYKKLVDYPETRSKRHQEAIDYTIEQVINLYTQTNRSTEADQWRQKLTSDKSSDDDG